MVSFRRNTNLVIFFTVKRIIKLVQLLRHTRHLQNFLSLSGHRQWYTYPGLPLYVLYWGPLTRHSDHFRPLNLGMALCVESTTNALNCFTRTITLSSNLYLLT